MGSHQLDIFEVLAAKTMPAPGKRRATRRAKAPASPAVVEPVSAAVGLEGAPKRRRERRAPAVVGNAQTGPMINGDRLAAAIATAFAACELGDARATLLGVLAAHVYDLGGGPRCIPVSLRVDGAGVVTSRQLTARRADPLVAALHEARDAGAAVGEYVDAERELAELDSSAVDDARRGLLGVLATRTGGT